MAQEINKHATRKHWKCFRKSEAPASQIMRSTWTSRIKRHGSTSDIIKFKALFCAYGRVQELGINFHETCTPVVKWNTIRNYLAMSSLNNWHTKTIDFDQAGTPEDCDEDI